MIRFADLTESQKAFICNGCGPKGGWVPVPDFLFHASCDHHDFNYWLGCTEQDRRKADHEFLTEMLKDAGEDPAMQTINPGSRINREDAIFRPSPRVFVADFRRLEMISS